MGRGRAEDLGKVNDVIRMMILRKMKLRRLLVLKGGKRKKRYDLAAGLPRFRKIEAQKGILGTGLVSKPTHYPILPPVNEPTGRTCNSKFTQRVVLKHIASTISVRLKLFECVQIIISFKLQI